MEDKEIYTYINSKVDKKLFYIVLPFIIAAIAHLYVIYFTGVYELKGELKLIQYQIQEVQVKLDVLTNSSLK